MRNGVQIQVTRSYRNLNDVGLVILPTASTTRPSGRSLDVMAGLAKANMYVRLPLLRVVERYHGGMPTTGDCLRDILKEIIRQPVMLGEFSFRDQY